MSKELEALKCLENIMVYSSDYYDGIYRFEKEFNTIKQALHRLETIDNANSSEAMKCVLDIENNYKFYAHNKQDIDYQCSTIKQALLKAQEPKQYLKWEDLEFNIDKQMMTVLLNGTKYTLIVGRNVHIDKLAFLRNGEITYYFLEADIQFFNDLHLEVIEE